MQTALGGGGGDIGKKINFGGGDGGDDDGGDDDDYFDEFDEGDEGDDSLFRRRVFLEEVKKIAHSQTFSSLIFMISFIFKLTSSILAFSFLIESSLMRC